MGGIEALLQGRVVGGRYRIEEVIGRGGMGAVYRATDERLGRAVAVKVITLSGGDPEARERLRQRFLREARAAAALPHHPNVVPVYDYGLDTELGLDYIVMELLRGEDLASRLARAGAPPVAEALHILAGATRGVAVGHRAGVVHRDVKPGNIYLVDDDGELQVRVLDFGIAKLADDDTLTQLTQDGRAPLSPASASPEQLRGLSGITPASDVFSLGAVGFQLLTGERPFTDADRNRISLGMPVDIPSVRDRNPAVPPRIDAALQQALSFHPEERFADATVFGAELEQARRELGDIPIAPYTARPAVPSRPAPAAPPPDERTEFLDDRTLLDPDAPAVEPARPPAPAPQRAVPPRLPPRRREPEPRGMGAFLLAVVTVLLMGAGGVVAWWMLTDPAPPVAEAPPPPDELPPIVPEEDPVPETPPLALEAYIQNQEGLRHYRADGFDAAREHFQRAVALAPDSAGYRYNLGLSLLRLGELTPAVREFERTLQQDPDRAAAHYYLGEARLELGDTAVAVEALESAVQLTTDPRERAIAERRLQEVRAAILRPAPPAPEAVEPPTEPAIRGGPPPGRGSPPAGPPGAAGRGAGTGPP